MRSQQDGLEYTDEEKYLFSIITGAFRSKLLAAAIDFDLFTWISNQTVDFQAIQVYLGFDERSTGIFLDALVNMNLLQIEKEKYKNSNLSKMYLIKGKLAYQGNIIKMFDSLYNSSSLLKEGLKEGKPRDFSYTYFFDRESQQSFRYINDMTQSCSNPALGLSYFFDFSDCRKILDVGGGYGNTAMILVTEHPDLSVIIFDLPHVCAGAKQHIQKFWLSQKIDFCPGDFFEDDFPRGIDTILMMRICHDWSLSDIHRLISKSFDVLPSGGKLLIYETLKQSGPSAPGDAAMISVLLMLISPLGECRTFEQYKRILLKTGFIDIQCIQIIFLYQLIVAIKP